ncbi:MAG: DUF393 domain-containing protein [Armatimonadetes bacterium]|nr:DUF393 domain-containing protein [Armatimonadota bacterium]
MKPITVYLDGECPLCVAGAVRFAKYDTANSVRFVNLHEPQWAARAAARFSPDDMHEAMRARMPDGTWRTGWFAWAAILSAIPAWHWLGRMMRLPVFYGVGPAFYRWVAGHRQEISRALRLPPPCDENGVCRIASRHPILAEKDTS